MTFFENSRRTLEKISFLDIETYTGENDFLGRAYANLRGWLRPCNQAPIWTLTNMCHQICTMHLEYHLPHVDYNLNYI
jgi:hypothetical protein